MQLVGLDRTLLKDLRSTTLQPPSMEQARIETMPGGDNVTGDNDDGGGGAYPAQSIDTDGRNYTIPAAAASTSKRDAESTNDVGTISNNSMKKLVEGQIVANTLLAGLYYSTSNLTIQW